MAVRTGELAPLHRKLRVCSLPSPRSSLLVLLGGSGEGALDLLGLLWGLHCRILRQAGSREGALAGAGVLPSVASSSCCM